MKFIAFIKIIFTLVFTGMLSSCGSASEEKKPETDINVATAFITYVMQGKFDKAQSYLLNDSTNSKYFEGLRKEAETISKEEAAKRRDAELIVNETASPADSIFILNYSPSFNTKEKKVLKLVRQHNTWLVDLKYSFSGNL